MKSTVKNVFLAFSLAALAMPVEAQNTGSTIPKTAAHSKDQKHRQKPGVQKTHSRKRRTGEAASLERAEAGQTSEDTREDNRGRLASARLQHRPSQVSKAVFHAPSITGAKKKSVHQARHTAQLKSGQLTSSQATHLKTNTVTLHHPTQSGRERERKITPEDSGPAQTKSGNQIHLKEHNARMF